MVTEEDPRNFPSGYEDLEPWGGDEQGGDYSTEHSPLKFKTIKSPKENKKERKRRKKGDKSRRR